MLLSVEKEMSKGGSECVDSGEDGGLRAGGEGDGEIRRGVRDAPDLGRGRELVLGLNARDRDAAKWSSSVAGSTVRRTRRGVGVGGAYGSSMSWSLDGSSEVDGSKEVSARI